jgi:outer membrane immunogenic protein
MLRRIALVAAAVAGLTITAQGQPAPVFNWTGFYIGGTLGYGWGDNRILNQATNVSTQNFDVDGFVGGLSVGYNWQAPGSRVVWGIEFDASYSGIDGFLAVAPGFGCGTGCASDLKWLGTVRGRLGHTFERTMLYVTGGFAFGEITGTSSTVGPLSASATGWTVGAGVEFALARNWSAKLEYLYVDLGDTVFGFTGVGSPLAVADLQINIVRIGANYRW